MPTNRIVAVLLTHKDETQLSWLEDARPLAARMSIDLVDQWTENSTVQSQQIGERVWKQRCDALIILAATMMGPTVLLREAVSRGKSVVLLNRTSTDMDENAAWSWPRLRRDFPGTLAASTVPDAVETGRVQARQLKAVLPNGGHVLHVLGDPASFDGKERLRGMEESLAGDDTYKVSKVTGGFQETLAEETCMHWLRFAVLTPDFSLDVVVSQSEIMIPGIRRAVENAARRFNRPDLRNVPMLAIDGLPRYKKEIDKGLLTATVEMPSRVSSAIETLARYWQTGTKPTQPIIHLPVASYPSLDILRSRGVSRAKARRS
ncbi:MAG: substrate-binding domain-containing protein [Vicinamibacteria bacterium]|nr:substrate-binding domain-containing protein [Vicinamibacteria bacterium]